MRASRAPGLQSRPENPGTPTSASCRPTTWRTLPEGRKSPASDAEWKLLLKEYPQLIRRPVVVTGDGVISQGFSDNGFKKRFGVGG